MPTPEDFLFFDSSRAASITIGVLNGFDTLRLAEIPLDSLEKDSQSVVNGLPDCRMQVVPLFIENDFVMCVFFQSAHFDIMKESSGATWSLHGFPTTNIDFGLMLDASEPADKMAIAETATNSSFIDVFCNFKF